MAKSKKNHGLLHPLDTITHWYGEAQAIPAQFKKSIAGEEKKAVLLVKNLQLKLKKAKALQKKARLLQTNAAKKSRTRSTNISRALVKKTKSHYQTTHHTVEQLTKALKTAKTQLNYARLKQKYFHALEAAWMSVTQIFSKKHAAKS